MRLFVMTICLFGTAIICGGQEPTVSPSPSVNTTSALPVTNITAVTNSSDITVVTNSSDITDVTGDYNTTAETNSTAMTPTSIPSTITTQSGGGGEDTGGQLSDGAIAGIVIGSLAGVAVLGGGVYGALKYTGKI